MRSQRRREIRRCRPAVAPRFGRTLQASGPGRVHPPSFVFPAILFLDAVHFLPHNLATSRFLEIPLVLKVKDSTGPSLRSNILRAIVTQSLYQWTPYRGRTFASPAWSLQDSAAPCQACEYAPISTRPWALSREAAFPAVLKSWAS